MAFGGCCDLFGLGRSHRNRNYTGRSAKAAESRLVSRSRLLIRMTRDAMCAHVYRTRHSDTLLDGSPANPRYSSYSYAAQELTGNLGKFFAMPPTAKPAPPQQASLTELWKRPKSTRPKDAAKKEPDSMETEDAAEG